MDELTWREHLAKAEENITAVENSGDGDEAPYNGLVLAVHHLTAAVSGLVAANPQVTRWKPDAELPPAGNVPQEAGTSHVWPPRQEP